MRFSLLSLSSSSLFRILLPAVALTACGLDPMTNEDVEGAQAGLTKGNGGVNGVDTNYCDDPLNLCVAGESDCDFDTQCQGALVCGIDNGDQFGFGDKYDVCVEAHCRNDVLDADETFTDCGGADCGSNCAAICGDLPASPSVNACNSDCPCSAGESDCNVDADCSGALVCGENNGDQFGFGTNFDVCVDAHCTNGVQDVDETAIDCGGADCGSICGVDCSGQPASGTANRCSNQCVCSARDGDCDSDAQCGTGLECVDNVGASFGFSSNTDVCLATTCSNSTQDGDETGVDCGPSCLPCSGSTIFLDGYGTTGKVTATSVAVDSTGAVIIGGFFFDSTNLGGSTFTRVGSSVTTTDIFMAKYDSTGAHEWSQAFGSDASDGNLAVQVAVGPNDEIALAGNFNRTVDFGTGAMTAAGRVDAFVAVFESDGTARWSQGWGGTEIDATYGVRFNTSGEVVAVGAFQETADFGAGNVTSTGASDIFVSRLSGATGATLATTTFGGTEEDTGFAVATQGTRLYVGGSYRSTVTFGTTSTTSSGSTDGFVLELNMSTLAVARTRFFGGTNAERVFGIDADPALNIYITGVFGSTVDFGSGVMATSNGGLDAYLLSLRGTLAPQWVQTLGGTANDEGRSVTVNDTSREVFLAGTIEGDVDFSGGTSTGLGGKDAFFFSYDQTGTALIEQRDGGTSADGANGVWSAAGRVGYAGFFQGSATIAGEALTSAGSNDVFVGSIAD